jgi:hypothetical protein
MIANKYANKIGQITEDDRIHLLSIIDYLGAIGVRVER